MAPEISANLTAKVSTETAALLERTISISSDHHLAQQLQGPPAGEFAEPGRSVVGHRVRKLARTWVMPPLTEFENSKVRLRVKALLTMVWRAVPGREANHAHTGAGGKHTSAFLKTRTKCSAHDELRPNIPC